MKKRKPETPRPKAADPGNAREARIQSKTVRDLAGMLRQIVAARGNAENRLDYRTHPLRPPIMDAFHLACALDPCKQTDVDDRGWWTTRRIEPPDLATGLQSNVLNRAAVVLMKVLERMRRGEADAGENADLLAVADALDGGKAQDGKGGQAEGRRLTHDERLARVLAFVKSNPDLPEREVARQTGIPASTFRQWPEYLTLRDWLAGEVRRGHKTRDGRVEAYD